jgi:hypothetical protein
MQIPAIVNEKLPNFVRQTYNVSCLLNVSFGFGDLIGKYEHLLILPVKIPSPALTLSGPAFYHVSHGLGGGG